MQCYSTSAETGKVAISAALPLEAARPASLDFNVQALNTPAHQLSVTLDNLQQSYSDLAF